MCALDANAGAESLKRHRHEHASLERISEDADALLSNSCLRDCLQLHCGQANESGQANVPPRQYSDCPCAMQFDCDR
jgi:hypothetical protein